MDSRFDRQYRALRDIRELCAKHPEAFTNNSMAAAMLAQLDTSVEAITAGLNDHQLWVSVHRQSTVRRRAGRTALRQSLEGIARTGPLVSRDTGTVLVFDVPYGGKDQQLINVADDFAKRAAPLADRFAAYKLPATVLTDLPAQAAELDGAIGAQREARRNHKAVRETLAAAMQSGWDAVDALERLYLNVFRTDPRALTDWKEARRIGPSQQPVPPAVTPAKGSETEVAPTQVA